MILVLCIALGPLAWAACSEPGPASSPSVAGTPTSPNKADDSPATPASFAAALAAIPRHDAGDNLSKEECEELHSKAFAAQRAAGDAALSCTADSDCGEVVDVFCGHGSCDWPIANAAKDKYEADMARIDKVTCPAWDAADCWQKAPQPVPSCARPTLKCNKGRCDFVF